MSDEKKIEQPKEEKIKISLKEMPKKEKKPEPPVPKEVIPDIAPPMPKGSQLKEIESQTPIPYQPTKEKPKETKLNSQPESAKKEKKQEQKSQPKVEPLPLQKPYIPLKEEKKEEKNSSQSQDSLAWMHEDKSAEETKKTTKKIDSSSSLTQDIKELYGDEFGKLTPVAQKYILDNTEIMRRITQETLTRVASVNLSRDLNMNATNVIEFYLHPNGDMTDFKFLHKSGHFELDNTTKETIEYSYSKYPRPTEKILIRYNVFYNLAHR